MRMITDMRRQLIGEGSLRGSPAQALQKTERPGILGDGGERAARLGQRAQRAIASERSDSTCCIGLVALRVRSADSKGGSQLRAIASGGESELAVLGTEERCTGESARRMGDELIPATGRAECGNSFAAKSAADCGALPALRE